MSKNRLDSSTSKSSLNSNAKSSAAERASAKSTDLNWQNASALNKKASESEWNASAESETESE